MPWNSTALPWHIEYMFQAMFYMVLGYMFRHQFEAWFDRRNTRKVRITICTIYLVLVFVSYLIKTNMPVMIDILYDYVSSILGIIAVVLVAKVMKSGRYVSFVGRNTLIYFALHGKVYSVIQTMLKRFAGGFYYTVLGNVAASSVFCLIFSLVISVVLIIPAYIINRWFPFIIGKKKDVSVVNFER